MPIDARYVDVDFRNATPDGMSRGCLYETKEEMFGRCAAPRYADQNTLIPESDWPTLCAELEEEMRQGVRRVSNQDGEGACVSHATINSMQYRMYHALGKKNWIPLSPMSLYKRIGDSAQSGAFVSDGAKYSQREGVLPLAGQNYPHTHPEIGFRNRLPDGWKDTAKLFRAEWQAVDSVEEIVSACLQFKPIIIGRRGHSIMYFLPHYEGGNLFIGYAQSWGPWGEVINAYVGKGLGWDTRRNMARDGYACELVTVRSEIAMPGQPTTAGLV